MFNVPAQAGIAGGIYPEGEEPRFGWADKVGSYVGGMFAPWLRPRAAKFNWIVELVSSHAGSMKDLTIHQISQLSRSLRKRLRREGYSKELVAETFALIREVADRTLGMPHFDVQLIGGWALLNGMVAEMETGEGKTLTATLPACTAALAGVPVHIVTVNDYLAERDAEWMEPIYRTLGLTVGVIKHGLDHKARRAAYRCDVTYCTNKEVAFDYLRDRIVLWDRPSRIRLQLERLYGDDSRVNRLVMRGLHYAIVDEADSVLIDEARTPLIISGGGDNISEELIYHQALCLAKELEPKRDFSIFPSERRIELKDLGKERIEEFARSNSKVWPSPLYCEEMVHQALVALNFFSLDKHYLIKDGKVQIIDEYTGRVMEDRSWERGLHQLIEAKEGCETSGQIETQARISYQRFFRRYMHLAGMTGTAREVAGELWSIYRMRVVSIPTNRPLQRTYLPDCVYSSAEKRWEAVIDKIRNLHANGRPVLVGTRSVEASEHLSQLLSDAGLEHKVLNARQDKEEAEIIALAGEKGRITVATNMAGRGTDISLAKGVAELGGLHVLATERHEARRIDRQLFGRCGRQGDPGSCEAMVSLEDELTAVYVSTPLRWLTNSLLRNPNNGWGRGVAGILFNRAQHRAERLHGRMRRELLKMDEYLGDALAFSGRPE
jgi:preprotein translocase subunit SecA